MSKPNIITTHDNGTVAASQTDSTLIAAVTGRIIVVHKLTLSADGTATDLTLNTKGSGAGTAIWGPHQLAANGIYNIDTDVVCNRGEALTATTGSGATVTIDIDYSLR